VDDVEGSAHHAYGLMPNMSWVLDRGGTILYKAEWTSAARIDDFLERRQTQRTGVTTPFHTEQLELRTVDRDAFYRGLQCNGPRAFTEFKRAEEIWAARARK
jgi:hypothetical protein